MKNDDFIDNVTLPPGLSIRGSSSCGGAGSASFGPRVFAAFCYAFKLRTPQIHPGCYEIKRAVLQPLITRVADVSIYVKVAVKIRDCAAPDVSRRNDRSAFMIIHKTPVVSSIRVISGDSLQVDSLESERIFGNVVNTGGIHESRTTRRTIIDDRG